MHRIDTPTAQKDKFGAGKNGFTRGNPQTGTPATELDDDYFDMLQEELAGVVEATGTALDKSKNNQLLTALKSLLLSRAHPFADIKGDGTAAVAEALENLGLGDAAKRGVWGGSGAVTAAGGFSLGVTGAFKLPTGNIVQWDEGFTASGGFTKNYPVPFPNQCLVLIPVVYSTLGAAYSVLANKSSKTQANFNVVNTSGAGVSGISAGYIAIGY
ncbi:hypothetical protein L8O47_02190 [Enterobacter roggenkampii]|uniref:gp53-like domain-containing protein n=1 Tax=Enterobacter roggenkampii TaxID=1812935 RepID=UPI0020051FA1|nr:hypothetical protein [Enterobacter roggenkampii]MCK7149732.1 hypothetical protein [Enterobacter roggenkampii]